MSTRDNADAGTATAPGRPASRAPVPCTHCGLPVPPGLVEADDERQFCCAGCRTAYAILHEHGLDHYYDLPERRDRPVVRSGRRYEEFDHPAFHSLYVTPTGDGLSRVELYLEGVRCASCVWLVERVPLVLPGVVRTELNIRRSLATIEWDSAAVPLSRVAQMLDSLGYPPHPFRGVKRDEIRRGEDRSAMIRIGVAGALAMNTMLAALALYSGWGSGMEAPYERFFRWVSLILATPALIWPGRVFFTSALAALRTKTLHMDLPIALALGAGFVRGVTNTITDSGPIYFDGLVMLVFVLLVGRFLQQRGQRAAADAAELLYGLTPSSARVVAGDGALQEVPAEAIVPGHVLDVRAGESLAADGVVEAGESSVNVSLLTGESRPVSVRAGDPVYAGTVNVASALRVRVTQAGEESRVARIMRAVEESARHRAPVVQLADRLSGWFTGAVIALAVAVYVIWLGRDPSRAMDNAIALLIVTCPCALALATPLAVTAAIGRAARAGIYVKGGTALEQLAHPARLWLDKTGTITEARTSLVEWDGPEWVKPLVLSLERESSHPIADGVRLAFGSYPTLAPEWSRHVLGGGIEGRVQGRHVVLGAPRFVQEALARACDPGVAASEEREGSDERGAREERGASEERSAGPHAIQDAVALERALTPVWVAVDGRVVAQAGFGDPVRPDAREAIASLQRRGWRVGILSGDDRRVVEAVARQVRVSHEDAIGGASPEEKLRRVMASRRDGRVVMVGDGVNDAAAIAAASVGIGVHGGAEACLASADVYLTRPGLSSLVQLVDGSRRTMAIIRRGIWYSLAYNVVGVGLAMTGQISPLVAAIMMPASSLTVLVAAWRGRTFSGERA